MGSIPNIARGATPPAEAVQHVQARMQGLIDVVDPQWPEGCELLLARPGSLEVAGRIMLPKGALVLYVDPETAEHLRPLMRQQIEEARRAAARFAEGAQVRGGALGRRGR